MIFVSYFDAKFLHVFPMHFLFLENFAFFWKLIKAKFREKKTKMLKNKKISTKKKCSQKMQNFCETIYPFR